ncbi:MAG: PAS domain-containing sensor histidine kinase [Desulfobacteraceae bacterium]|nr:MAG: PAS domain-containing sensor histidine kinase [Desulfobacteraceae bacterium]
MAHTHKNISEDLAIYKEMLEHLDDIVFSHDVEGRLTYVSPSWQHLLNYTDEEIARLDFQSILPDEYLAEAIRRTEKQLRGEPVEQPWELEIYDHERNRIWMQIRTRAVYDHAGNFVKVFGVARNIQEKKQIEARLHDYTQNLEKLVEDRTRTLRESGKKYRLLVENAHDAIFITQDDKIIFANPSTLRILGYDMETLSRIPITDMIHPDDRMEMLHFYHEKFTRTENENLGYYTFRGIHRTGEILWLQINAVRTVWKKKPATLNFVRDISHEKRLERQLLQAQKMEAIGNLAGGIAHDFNNILSAIIGYTEMSLAEAPKDTQIPRRLKRVLEAGHRAGDLVARILDFSRQTDSVKQPTSVANVVREALALLQASIPSTIQFKESIEKDAGEVHADPTQIHQVVMNLCTNAAHAMQENGGELKVRVGKTSITETDKTTFAVISPGPYVCLSISDTGHGMDSGMLHKIFDPYFTTKKKGEGTGLGLSVVHGIVKGLGGEIKVYSEPGKGTAFHVYLPRIESDAQKTVSDQTPMPSGSETILVVDDEEFIIDMISEMLSGLGYRVESRISSYEALEAFRSNPKRFDLVITDQTMPQLTGTALSAKIKVIRPDIPIILCSGFSVNLENDSRHDTIVDAHINKPILNRELAETIRSILDSRKKPQASPS